MDFILKTVSVTGFYVSLGFCGLYQQFNQTNHINIPSNMRKNKVYYVI